ncbi:pilin [Vandammella animalimorsus]|uniref:pilin n=1 Tax=Vandammella animalimorsus TaxID=2029117 RepID=UPI000BAA7117|nr:pilin [Vandammella animalimorsus]PAT31275.1 hypothetical protein CK626_10875 [Vandammella animalimorsus]
MPSEPTRRHTPPGAAGQRPERAQSAPPKARTARPRPVQRPAQARSLPIWAVVLIAVATAALAVAVYDFTIGRPQRDIARNVARETAEHMKQEHQQRLEQAVAQTRRMERLRQVVSSAAGVRVAIAEYLAEHSELPTELRQLSIDTDYTPSNLLASVQLRPGGVIVLQPIAGIDLDGQVLLIPDAVPEQGMIRGWDCTSADFDFIATAIPNCRYVKAR